MTQQTALDANKLADDVERGRISRNVVRRLYGRDIYDAVRKVIAARNDARSNPHVVVVDESFDESPECIECGGTVADGDTRCERCEALYEWHVWLDATLDAVEMLAAAHGWSFDRNRYSGGFNTISRYYDIDRQCAACESGDDGYECSCKTLKLRIIDHGTCYCNEDISIAKEPSGDDHTIEQLVAVMAAE